MRVQGVRVQTVARAESVQRPHGHGDGSQVRQKLTIPRLVQHGPNPQTVRSVNRTMQQTHSSFLYKYNSHVCYGVNVWVHLTAWS